MRVQLCMEARCLLWVVFQYCFLTLVFEPGSLQILQFQTGPGGSRICLCTLKLGIRARAVLPGFYAWLLEIQTYLIH